MALLLENAVESPRGESALDTITIGPGPRNATTDPTTGLRFYEWQGRRLPSVTTVRRLAGLPHGLHQWALSKVIDRATNELGTLTLMLNRERRPRERVLEKNRIVEASKWLRQAATEERDAAAELGTAVHDAAAQNLRPEDVEPAIRPRLEQFRRWLQASGAQIAATEFQCWNLTAGYAGTADFIALFPGSEGPWLVDIKSGKGVYSEHSLQLSAYRHAEFVGTDDQQDPELTMMLRACVGSAVLHLADDHWEFRVLRDDPSTFEAFCGLLSFATWMAANPDAEAVTVASRRGGQL